MREMIHLLPPDYEAVLVKLIAKLPKIEFPEDYHQMYDVSDRIARVDDLKIVNPIAIHNTRMTGHYNTT